jgi:CxxC-x17-CxxC domain-containing protein
MKRKSKHEDTSVLPQAEPDMAVLMAQIQQQLVILEKKMDSLISQSSEKSFKGEHYSKPFGRFDHFRRHEKRDQGNSYSERRFTKAICADCHKECEVPFKPTGDRPVYCKDCFSRRKQGSSFKGEYDKGPGTGGDFTQRKYSDKKQSRKNQGYGERKPVSRRRKERA